jgi:Tfp pilus assembly protein PilZ
MTLQEHILQIRFPNRRYVLSTSRAEGTNLELFAPTAQRVPLGRRVRLMVTFEDAPERFELTGKVVFHRGATRNRDEQGVGVSFEGDDKKRAAELLAFCAGRPAVQGTATWQRFVTRIRCKVEGGSEAYSGEVLDLSLTGLFVSMKKAPKFKAGAKLQVRLKPSTLSFWGKAMDVKVMWSGEKRGLIGFGGRFLVDHALVSAELRKYVSAAQQK